MSLREKLSGVILDDQLRWNDYDEQSKKIAKGIALLRRAKFFVAKDTLTKMYKSLFCRISHTVRPIWHDGNNSHITKQQKRAARVITNSNNDIRSFEIFDHLKWEPIEATLDKREQIMTLR